MRSPLDLNNLPDDHFFRDHTIQSLDDSSSAASGIYRKKKSGSKDDKVYECRFCSLKFGKSQALGGHMNRHRQERETETLNQARQLVFSTDNLVPQPAHQLGGQPAVHGGYHYPATGFNIGGTVYPTRLYSGTSTTIIPPAAPLQHAYTSLLSAGYNNIAYSSQYPNSGPSPNDYFVERYASSNPQFGFQNLGGAAVPTHDSAYN